MKTILIILLCATVLLWGCSSDTKVQQDLRFTNERINVLSTEIREINYQNTIRDSDIISLKEKIDWYKQAYIQETKKQECVPFIPKIGDIVYQDITDEEVANDDFYLQYGEIMRKKWRKYLKMDVQSYAVEWDCVVYINQMWPNWINKI